MKVVCINNFYGGYITPGKVYLSKTLEIGLVHVVDSLDEVHYRIVDDKGNDWWYPSELFKTLEDIRNEKLDQIL